MRVSTVFRAFMSLDQFHSILILQYGNHFNFFHTTLPHTYILLITKFKPSSPWEMRRMPFESASSWTFFLRGGLALLHLRTCLDASRVFPSALPKDDDGLFLCSDCLLDSASFYSLGFYFYWGRARETQSRRRNGSGEKKKKNDSSFDWLCCFSRSLSPGGVCHTLYGVLLLAIYQPYTCPSN